MLSAGRRYRKARTACSMKQTIKDIRTASRNLVRTDLHGDQSGFTVTGNTVLSQLQRKSWVGAPSTAVTHGRQAANWPALFPVGVKTLYETYHPFWDGGGFLVIDI
jgi:hypothetical protein